MARQEKWETKERRNEKDDTFIHIEGIMMVMMQDVRLKKERRKIRHRDNRVRNEGGGHE